MRTITLIFLATLAYAIRIPDIQSFLAAFTFTLEDYLPPVFNANATSADETAPHDLLKRQYSNTCPKHFNSCDNLGAPSLCCADGAVCSADAAGHVACCPSGAACSGTINGIITAGTVNSDGSLIGGSATTTGGGGGAGTTTHSLVPAGATTTSGGLVQATTESQAKTQTPGQYYPSTSGNGFVVDGTSTVATPGAAVRAVQVVSIHIVLQNSTVTDTFCSHLLRGLSFEYWSTCRSNRWRALLWSLGPTAFSDGCMRRM